MHTTPLVDVFRMIYVEILRILSALPIPCMCSCRCIVVCWLCCFHTCMRLRTVFAIRVYICFPSYTFGSVDSCTRRPGESKEDASWIVWIYAARSIVHTPTPTSARLCYVILCEWCDVVYAVRPLCVVKTFSLASKHTSYVVLHYDCTVHTSSANVFCICRCFTVGEIRSSRRCATALIDLRMNTR